MESSNRLVHSTGGLFGLLKSATLGIKSVDLRVFYKDVKVVYTPTSGKAGRRMSGVKMSVFILI